MNGEPPARRLHPGRVRDPQRLASLRMVMIIVLNVVFWTFLIIVALPIV